jgi:hypothetical protein
MIVAIKDKMLWHLANKINLNNESCEVICGEAVSCSVVTSECVLLDYHQIVQEIASSNSMYNMCIGCEAHFMHELLPMKWNVGQQQQEKEEH